MQARLVAYSLYHVVPCSCLLSAQQSDAPFDSFKCPPDFDIHFARSPRGVVTEKRCVVSLVRPRAVVGNWGLVCGHVWNSDVGYWYVCVVYALYELLLAEAWAFVLA